MLFEIALLALTATVGGLSAATAVRLMKAVRDIDRLRHAQPNAQALAEAERRLARLRQAEADYRALDADVRKVAEQAQRSVHP